MCTPSFQGWGCNSVTCVLACPACTRPRVRSPLPKRKKTKTFLALLSAKEKTKQIMMVKALLHSGRCLGDASLGGRQRIMGNRSKEVNGQGLSTLGAQGDSQGLRWVAMNRVERWAG